MQEKSPINADSDEKSDNKSEASAGANVRQLADEIFEMLDQKKAEELVLMDLRSVNSYFNYFLLATANSPMHLKSLAREIMKNFADRLPPGFGGSPGTDDIDSGWIVIDFIDLVVHIFLEEPRQFYNLERLWGDAEIIRTTRAEK